MHVIQGMLALVAHSFSEAGEIARREAGCGRDRLPQDECRQSE
jgi:hypothetical protein